jgi:sugar lactone lactonase YvrE
VDGPNTTAQFFNPEDAAYDPISGNIYVADFLNQRVRVLAPVTFTVSTISHVFGSNPFNDEVWFDGPLALVVAPVRNIYVATNRSISQIVATGATPVVVAIPSLTNAFRLIEGMTFDGTTFTLYVSDILAQAIYSVNLQSTVPQPVLLAGIPSSPVPNGQRNAFDGVAPTARFAGPAGIAFDPFNRLLFVADFAANAIRTVSITPPHTVTTIAGDIVSQSGAPFTPFSSLYRYLTLSHPFPPCPYSCPVDAFHPRYKPVKRD